MPSRYDCSEFRKNMYDYYYGESSPEARRAMEEHLHGCRECAHVYEEWCSAASLLYMEEVEETLLAGEERLTEWLMRMLSALLTVTGLSLAAYMLVLAFFLRFVAVDSYLLLAFVNAVKVYLAVFAVVAVFLGGLLMGMREREVVFFLLLPFAVLFSLGAMVLSPAVLSEPVPLLGLVFLGAGSGALMGRNLSSLILLAQGQEPCAGE